jgi:ABC-2 type transport system permease protein
MNAHRIWAVTSRHLYVYKRSPVRLAEMIYWPFLDLVLWGFVSLYLRDMGHAAGAGGAAANFVAFFIGALILWDLLFRAQQGVSLAYLEEVWARNLLNLFVSPLTVGEFLTRTLVISFVKLLFSVVVMGVLAFAFYGFNLLMMGLALVPFVANLLLFGWALGIFTTAMVLRLGQGAESLAWVVAFAFQPLACVFYPVSVLPQWLQPVALATPAAHIFEGMRAVIGQGAFPVAQIGWAFGLNAIYMGAAVWFFYRTFALVRERGLLAKTGE